MIVAVSIQKGGTGKTTTAAALAQAGAFKRRKVLAVDLDPQANLSFALGADTGKAGSYEVLTGEKAAADVMQKTAAGVYVIAASWSLSTITGSRGSARRLQSALEPIKDSFDLIVIDTPPTAGELQYNALQAAERLVIPLEADIYNLQSLYQITEAARQIQATNSALKIAGFIFTKYDNRSTLARQISETIQGQAANIGVPFLGSIRNAIAVKEAAALQRSLYEYAPNSKPAADYLEVYNKLYRSRNK